MLLLLILAVLVLVAGWLAVCTSELLPYGKKREVAEHVSVAMAGISLAMLTIAAIKIALR